MQGAAKKLTVVAVAALAVLAPLTVVLSVKLFSGGKSYYIPAVLLVLLSLLPFFAYFEGRKIKTGELVVIASAIAAAVAGRALMSFLPQLKPTAAIVLVTAAAFGGSVGFITGSLSMLLSNFIFGQGIFTPFQMLGMGLVGFFGGLLLCGRPAAANRWILSLTGAALTFFVYGAAVDGCSVLTMAATPAAVWQILASGAVFNLIHAANTAVLLFLIGKPMRDKFSRLRIKYGIFDRAV